MREKLTSGKDMVWHLHEMKKHVAEIEELYHAGDKIYKGDKTCREHAKTEAYDLIVLTAEAFDMQGILACIPEDISERFLKKGLNPP